MPCKYDINSDDFWSETKHYMKDSDTDIKKNGSKFIED